MTNNWPANTDNQIKRVAAVHDLCGYGKCSLGIAIPVLSAAGLEVCSVPTGVFSMHTAMKNWTMLDTSDILDDYINSWKQEGVIIDAVYSGFLSNKSQVYNILQLYANYPDAIKFVDPVMGDNGKLYKTYNDKLCQEMKKIIAHADYLTPNLTEAYVLCDKKYNENPDDNEIENLLKTLRKLGAKNIVLTGIIRKDENLNFIYDTHGQIFVIKNKHIDKQIHGTGDLFSSCLFAALMNNWNLEKSIKFSCNFLCDAIQLTTKQKGFEKRGISFEPLLKNIKF